MVTQMLIVSQQQRRTGDLAKHHIEIPIPVDIGERRTAPDDRFEEVRAAFARGNRHKAEALDITAIPKQLRGLTVLLGRFEAINLWFKMPICSQNIQPPIQVVIEKEQPKFQQILASGPQTFL